MIKEITVEHEFKKGKFKISWTEIKGNNDFYNAMLFDNEEGNFLTFKVKDTEKIIELLQEFKKEIK